MREQDTRSYCENICIKTVDVALEGTVVHVGGLDGDGRNITQYDP